jgi:hypothetical protein
VCPCKPQTLNPNRPIAAPTVLLAAGEGPGSAAGVLLQAKGRCVSERPQAGAAAHHAARLPGPGSVRLGAVGSPPGAARAQASCRHHIQTEQKVRAMKPAVNDSARFTGARA